MSVAARQGPVPVARVGRKAVAVPFAEQDHEQTVAHWEQSQVATRGSEVRNTDSINCM